MGLVAGLLARAAAWVPAAAQAHGPSAPIASSYLAKLESLPSGVKATILGADQRMWLQVAPSDVLVVLDYRGVPYLRFSRAGVAVNAYSSMYYLNQPTPLKPPLDLPTRDAPWWVRASFGHVYAWHDGRLHALAAVALAAGTRLVGTWRIPVTVDGRPSAISGVLLHAGAPSPVWFWPIAVLLRCALAVVRLRRRALDAQLSRATALVAATAIAVGFAGSELYGRPNVAAGQIFVVSVVVLLIANAMVHLVRREAGAIAYVVIPVAALWEGAELVPTLLHGFVLTALPTFVARAAAVACLGCGAMLVMMLLARRLAPTHEGASS